MAVFRCKICGGDLVVQEGVSSCVCEYCGSRQTLPAVRDENLTALFNRANVLRMKCEFDKAAEIYEKIIQGNSEESEAYWGLILCKYGIEYVEDPESRERIPTCHRASYDAVTADEDYRSAIRYADAERRQLYLKEAMRIDEIQRGIIALAQKESPYDVFICYKESDGGSRTQDSVIANDIYYQLTAQNLKVFYAAVTLEDKLGTEYEPVIFSALNSAKVMLVLGTKPEYFNAVWVKNEWSRFLKLMKKDRTRMLIPCYRDMDPYELPEEFAHLQAQNMGKIGFITDLVRGIRKVMMPETPAAVPAAAVPVMAVPAAADYVLNYNALLKRGFMALEDNKWEDADDFFEQVLNQDAECGEAYWGKYLAEKKCSDGKSLAKKLANAGCDKSNVKPEMLEAFPADSAHVEAMVKQYSIPNFYDEWSIRSAYEFKRTYPSVLTWIKERKQEIFRNVEADRTLMRAKKYANESLRNQISQFHSDLERNIDEMSAREQRSDTEKISELRRNYQSFLKKTDEKVVQHFQQVSADMENRYQQALQKMKEKHYSEAKSDFIYLNPYKDSDQLIDQCDSLEEEAAKKNARTKTIILCICAVLAAVAIAMKSYFIPLYNYNQASSLMASGSYEEAIDAFAQVGDFKNSPAKIEECKELIKLQKYNAALALMEAEKYEEAIASFIELDDFKDSPAKIEECKELIKLQKYNVALALMEAEKYEEAIASFIELDNFKDSLAKIEECKELIKLQKYNAALALMEAEKYEEAIASFIELDDFKDSPAKIEECKELIKPQKYNAALASMEAEKYEEAIASFTELDDFKDSPAKIDECWLALCRNQYGTENINTCIALKKAHVGDHVYYGQYEQDNDRTNGAEEIEWRVLAREGNRLLLLSEYGLDARTYNLEWAVITWEKSTLRSWLNGEFYKSAFSAEEQAQIATTTVKAEKNPIYSTNPGNDTQDRIFLLSIREANTYFKSDDDRKCKVTAYAKANNAYSDSDCGGTGWWWLRSPGIDSVCAARVRVDGSFNFDGLYVDYSSATVRPALWLNL